MQDFITYLTDHEGKKPKTAQRYARMMAAFPPTPTPSEAEALESLQWAWLAYRRFAHRVGCAVTPWPPLTTWAKLPQWRDDAPLPDPARITVFVGEKNGTLFAFCGHCPDRYVEMPDFDLDMETARAAAKLVVQQHRSDPGGTGSWCEEVTFPTQGTAYHLLWQTPPPFRDWAAVSAARGPNGALAREAVANLAEERDAQLQREGETTWVCGGEDSSGCSCGYLAVGGGGGLTVCPICD